MDLLPAGKGSFSMLLMMYIHNFLHLLCSLRKLWNACTFRMLHLEASESTEYTFGGERAMKMKKKLIGIAALVVLVVGMVFAYNTFKEKPVEGSKEVTLEVVNSEEEAVSYELKTDAEYLIEVMDEAKDQGFTYEGEEGDYGLMINSVNGEEAVYETDGAYWAFFVNGEYCNYGVSEQPVEDGDAFQIVYTAE